MSRLTPDLGDKHSHAPDEDDTVAATAEAQALFELSQPLSMVSIARDT